MFSFLTAALGSRTLSLALSLIPLLGEAFDFKHPDLWVFEKIPRRLRKNATLAEFEQVIMTGKAFIKACYSFFHK